MINHTDSLGFAVRNHFRGSAKMASMRSVLLSTRRIPSRSIDERQIFHRPAARITSRPRRLEVLIPPQLGCSLAVSTLRHCIRLLWHEPKFEAPLRLNEQGIVVMVKVYPSIELKEFRRWFWLDYLPNNYITYLDNKPEFKQYESLARASAANNASLHLSGVPAKLDDDRREKLAEHGGFYKSPHIIPMAPKAPKRITKRSPRKGGR